MEAVVVCTFPMGTRYIECYFTVFLTKESVSLSIACFAIILILNVYYNEGMTKLIYYNYLNYAYI